MLLHVLHLYISLPFITLICHAQEHIFQNLRQASSCYTDVFVIAHVCLSSYFLISQLHTEHIMVSSFTLSLCVWLHSLTLSEFSMLYCLVLSPFSGSHWYSHEFFSLHTLHVLYPSSNFSTFCMIWQPLKNFLSVCFISWYVGVSSACFLSRFCLSLVLQVLHVFYPSSNCSILG